MSLLFSTAEIRQYILARAQEGVLLTPVQAIQDLEGAFFASMPKSTPVEPSDRMPVQYEDQYGNQRWTHNGSKV